MADFVVPPAMAPILAEAEHAFSIDTRYAIDIALSASDIINRKESVSTSPDAF